MELDVVVTPGLGDNSYLLSSRGEGLLVDPQRDAWRFLRQAESRNVRVRHVLETHVHNDYLTGALEVRASTGAEVGAPAAGRYEFAHRPMAEGDEVRIGELRVVAMATPGHTPEHTSYVVHEDGADAPACVFTGGSLIVGSSGRTDLLGDELTEELTRAQHRSLERLAALPDAVAVLPTHGGGSFCAAGAAGDRQTSTIGEERRTNPALSAPDEATFVRERLAGLLLYPTYYRHMAPINRRGPRVLGAPPFVQALHPAEVAAKADEGAWVVDARGRHEFAAGHIPGSLNVELSSSFGTYVGWVVPFDARLVLVLPDPQPASIDRALLQLIRIGYEHVEGYLEGGFGTWPSEGRLVRSYPTATVAELCEASREEPAPLVLDVRQPAEWHTGRFPGSLCVFMGDLPGRLQDIPRDREAWVICASGQRASLAASLLDRADSPVRLVAESGVDELLVRCSPRSAPASAG